MATLFTKIYRASSSGLLLATFLTTSFFASSGAVSAQAGFVHNKPGELPDSSQFYMSRRQIQYVDDSPIVKFGGGGAAGQGTPGGFGGMPAGAQMGLPRAGFQSYTTSAPSITTPLPKVNNGVPPKAPPVDEKAMRAKAAALSKAQKKAMAAAAPKPVQPSVSEGIKAYNSYKGYNPASSIGIAGTAGAASSSTAQVKGSVLHWSRKRSGQ
ncbi:MAG: hypothetical protein KGS72_28215 [Cyanobacteria bacterium REEB67]|nr:hypothetical protein [Cyanobacteria bacterium REEB67]